MTFTGVASVTDSQGLSASQPVTIRTGSAAPGGVASIRHAWFMQTNGADPVAQLRSMEINWFKRQLSGTTSNQGRGRKADGTAGGTVPYAESTAAAKRHVQKWNVPYITDRPVPFTLATTMSILCTDSDNRERAPLAYKRRELGKVLDGTYNQVFEDIAAIGAHVSVGGPRKYREVKRLAHEMDGLFYIHSAVSHPEAEWSAAWSHVVKIMRAVDPTLIFDYGGNSPSFIATVEEMQRRHIEQGLGVIPVNDGDTRWIQEYGFPGSVAEIGPGGADTGGIDMYVGKSLREPEYFVRLNRALAWCAKHRLPFTAYEIGAKTVGDDALTDTETRRWLQVLLHGGDYGDVHFDGLDSLPANMLEAVSYFVMNGDYSVQRGDYPLSFAYMKGGPQVSATSSGLGGQLLEA